MLSQVAEHQKLIGSCGDFRPHVWARYGADTQMLDHLDAGVCWFVKIKTPQGVIGHIRVLGNGIIEGGALLEAVA